MNLRIKNITLIGLTAVVCACNGISIEEDPCTGYLGSVVFDVDLTVDVFTQTKSAPDLKPLDVPALADVNFIVKDKDGSEKYNGKGVWAEPIVMPVGDYTIEARFGSNGFGAPFFSGTASGTIKPLATENPEVGMTLQNAMIAVGLKDDFKQHFIPDGENPLTITSTSGSVNGGLDTYFFVPAGEGLTITIAGASSAGIAKTLTYNLSALNAATAPYIECGLDSSASGPSITLSGTPEAWGTIAYVPQASTLNISDDNLAKMKYYASSDGWASQVEGSISGEYVRFTGLTSGTDYKVRAEIGALKSNVLDIKTSTDGLSVGSATHTYTSEILDGTDFTASYSIPEIIRSDISSVTLSLCKEDGTVLRSADLGTSSTTWASDGSADSDWPFLPEGTYTLKGQVIQNGKTVDFTSLQVVAPETPDFTVTVSGKTTYNYAQTDVSTANSKVAETIYEVGYAVTDISTNLLNNSNYGLTAQYAVNDNIVSLTENTITGCDWGENILTATVTFAGKPVTSGGLSCHITGLPYKATPPTNTGDHPWSGNANSWKSDCVRMYTHSITQTFYSPAEKIDISVYYKTITKSGGSRGYFYLYASGETIKEFEHYYGWATNPQTYDDEETISSVELTKDNPTIQCSTKQGIGGSGVNYIEIYSIIVNYQ
ncbi:MAG: DUF4493 domain-containing protein [Candidatus Cryptobacteroides sp.]